jgi:RimJ/RimL family protein N-acetyltransferase
MAIAPTLTTARLMLRPYVRAYFNTYAAFMASDRAVHMDGPLDRDKAWTWFTNDVATWTLYGFGTLAIEMDGKLAGGIGLVHPPHFPEPECGWFIYDGFTGLGLAAEAGRAIIDRSFATTTLDTIVSYIGNGNAASIRVAERLGAVLDPDAQAPEATGALVYRHKQNSSQRSVS